MTVWVADAHAHVQRLVSVVKMVTVPEECTTEEESSVVHLLWGLNKLDLGTSYRWVVSFRPRPLYSCAKRPRYPLDSRLDGPQNRAGRREEEKTLVPTGTQTSTPPTVQPIASRHTDCTELWAKLHLGQQSVKQLIFIYIYFRFI
jgi:hypothetical protein